MKEELNKFIEKRPDVIAAYGYGSGVFKQNGYTKKDKPQIDLIFVVKNLKKWHKENIKLNKKDYSFIGRLFFKYAKIKKLKGTTGITYLSNIEEDGKVFKYGTIEEKDLLEYLKTWESFYVPGRFQKPCLEIISTDEIREKIERNRKNALMVGLLTITKEECSLKDVYTHICRLSYIGDTRMKFAENPHKVSNIVKGSFKEYLEMYGYKNKYFTTSDEDEITINYKKLLDDIDMLPTDLAEYLNSKKDLVIVQDRIIKYLREMNKKESTNQTIKGIFTNGITRSIKYASKKVMKKFKKI